MSPTKPSVAARYLLVAVAVSLTGARPQCDTRTAGSSCPAPPILVLPGECVEIEDPCGNEWDDLVALSFISDCSGYWFRVERRPVGASVYLCAADTVVRTLGDAETFRVVRRSGEVQDVDLNVGNVAPLAASVVAVPEVVVALDTIQLTAHPSGGVPPYSYKWYVQCSEGEVIGPDTMRSATVFGSCDNYWLFLSDTLIGAKVFTAIVPTYPIVSVTATPTAIDPGGFSRLEPHVTGGEMVDDAWWSPETGLDTPQSYTTLAHPAVTTEYTFHVRTHRGLVASGSVTVEVRTQ